MRSVIAARALGLLAAGALLGCNNLVTATGSPVVAASATGTASTAAPAPTATAAPTTAAPTATTAPTTAAPTATAAPTQASTLAPTVGPTPTPAPTLTPTPTPAPTLTPTPTPSLTPTSTPAPAALAARYLQSTDLPPACPVSASDAPVCAVSFPLPGNYQVSASEYILFRVGWADPSPQSCDAFVSNTTTTFTIDGRAVGFVWVTCRFITSGVNAQNWFADMRYLSPPLSPGTHTATATIVYNAAVPGTGGPIPAGTVQIWTRTVTVP